MPLLDLVDVLKNGAPLEPGKLYKCPEQLIMTPIMTTQNDNVSSPSHYNRKGIECIAAIEAAMSEEEFLGYVRGNVLKYQWRCRYKGHTIEDIEKSIWYANKLKEKIKEYGKETPETTPEGSKTV